MLRKGIVALMISVMSVSSLKAADGKSSSSLLGLFRGPSGHPQQRTARTEPSRAGVQHAVVADADRQVPEIRQTSAQPPKPSLQPAESAPQPTPLRYAAPLPNVPPINGPQSFNATASAGPQGSVPSGAGGQQSALPHDAYYGPGGPFQFESETDGRYAGSAMPVSFPGGGHHLINGGYIPGNDGGYGCRAGVALYPAPRPGIPQQVGGTAIVHHALHPHEMMYAHRYKAMYGPYYYKVNGRWIVTPFGVWSKENWKLQGTTVDVKYKSHISPFAMFHPPVIH